MPACMPENVSLTGEASLQRSRRIITKCRNLARISRICLECAAIFSHLPLTVRCRLGDYTRAMMIKQILTICAVVTAGAAGTSLALAQGYPPPAPPSTVYSTPLPSYPPGGYPSDYRRAPDGSNFDALFDGPDDDEAPQARSSTAL